MHQCRAVINFFFYEGLTVEIISTIAPLMKVIYICYSLRPFLLGVIMGWADPTNTTRPVHKFPIWVGPAGVVGLEMDEPEYISSGNGLSKFAPVKPEPTRECLQNQKNSHVHSSTTHSSRPLLRFTPTQLQSHVWDIRSLTSLLPSSQVGRHCLQRSVTVFVRPPSFEECPPFSCLKSPAASSSPSRDVVQWLRVQIVVRQFTSTAALQFAAVSCHNVGCFRSQIWIAS